MRACGVALAAVVLVAWAASGGAGAAQTWVEVLRLRALAPGVAGSLEAGAAGRARLVAANLPRPDALAPDARAYVVWAVAGRVVRLGALRRGADGRASFEFAHPHGLPRYSLVVTAELSSDAARPSGTPVLSTRALEVDRAALAAARAGKTTTPARATTREATTSREDTKREGTTREATAREGSTREATTREGTTATPGRARPTRERVAPVARRGGERSAGGSSPAASSAGALAPLATEARSRVCAGGGCAADGFYREVTSALAAGDARRSLLLVGARGARAWARVSSRDGRAYARLRFRRVPPPARFGARRHVLWAVTDDAGPVYVGSLPGARLDRAPAFVRADGVGDPNFRLLVTAEKTYPAPRPAGRRVLATYRGRRRTRNR